MSSVTIFVTCRCRCVQTLQYRRCRSQCRYVLGPFHTGKLLESFFRKSLSKVAFERKLSGVSGPLSKVYHFRKWTAHTRKFSFESDFRKRLSKETFQ